MISPPIKKKFDELPEVYPQELANYFNLEFGISNENTDEKSFTGEDFTYVGVFETMFWSVADKNICATVQPFENFYIIAIDNLPSNEGSC
jgi:hypothetical protein